MTHQPTDWDGARIRQLRIRAGLSQAQLAEAINSRAGTRVHRHAVSRWESGHVRPSLYARVILDTLDQEVSHDG